MNVFYQSDSAIYFLTKIKITPKISIIVTVSYSDLNINSVY